VAEAADILRAVDGPSTRLSLRVSPGAARPGVVGRYGDSWKLRVKAAPERGRASEAVLELLAAALGVPRKDIELVTGQGSRDKTVVLRGLTAHEVDSRLEAAAGGAA
jgi:uncharacterized protein YggU (UPF0235/DUF167 family)